MRDARWTLVPVVVKAGQVPLSKQQQQQQQQTHSNHLHTTARDAACKSRTHVHNQHNHHSSHNSNNNNNNNLNHVNSESVQSSVASSSSSRKKCPIHHNNQLAPPASNHKHSNNNTTNGNNMNNTRRHHHDGSPYRHNHHHSRHHHHHPHPPPHSGSSCGSPSCSSDVDHDGHDVPHRMMMMQSSPESDGDIIEEKVYITLKTGQNLGCSVVRGPAPYPGIFVQDVKPGSPSSRAGLEVGDQILAMNGFSFYPGHFSFDDAINKIKACTQMTLTLRKGVGLHLFSDIRQRSHNVHRIRAVVHSAQANDSNESDYDPEKDFDLNKICGLNENPMTDVKHRLVSSGNSHRRVCSEDEMLCKVRQEEERLEEDRRILAAEKQKLRQEMQQLAIERKELEALRQRQIKSDDGGSSISSGDVSILSSSSSSPDPMTSCSVSSTSCNSSTSSETTTFTSNSVAPSSASSSAVTGVTTASAPPSSSGNQALGFLDELKQLAEKRSSSDTELLLDTLRKTGSDSVSSSDHDQGPGSGQQKQTTPGGRIRVVKQLHPDDEKRKRHELLMEEFKSAHLKMFGKASCLASSNKSPDEKESQVELNEENRKSSDGSPVLFSSSSGGTGIIGARSDPHSPNTVATGSIDSGPRNAASTITTASTTAHKTSTTASTPDVNGVTSFSSPPSSTQSNSGRPFFHLLPTSSLSATAPPSASNSSTQWNEKSVTGSVTASSGGTATVGADHSRRYSPSVANEQKSAGNVPVVPVTPVSRSSIKPQPHNSNHPGPTFHDTGSQSQVSSSGEKVMILKNTSCTQQLKKTQKAPPPPPPPPGTGTLSSPPGQPAEVPLNTDPNRCQAQQPQPLVTITSYQTKARPGNSRLRAIFEKEPEKSSRGPPVKINFIKTREEK